jgi:hypothetical protein
MPSSHLTHGDPRLSRFDPLSRIICFDDFDQGLNGWTALVGNYEGSIDTMTHSYARHTQPMLSQMTHWDAGTHGSVDGTYALKIATRAVPGERNVAIKRLTFRKASRIRVETYFAFKPEANELKLSDLDVRSVGLLFDLQDGQQRVMPHAGQKLCYNEIPTKINWHYLRFDFDLARMCWLGFQCNDQVFDCAQVESIRMPAMPNLSCMLNLAFFCEPDTAKRTFFYLDSVLLSGEF